MVLLKNYFFIIFILSLFTQESHMISKSYSRSYETIDKSVLYYCVEYPVREIGGNLYLFKDKGTVGKNEKCPRNSIKLDFPAYMELMSSTMVLLKGDIREKDECEKDGAVPGFKINGSFSDEEMCICPKNAGCKLVPTIASLNEGMKRRGEDVRNYEKQKQSITNENNKQGLCKAYIENMAENTNFNGIKYVKLKNNKPKARNKEIVQKLSHPYYFISRKYSIETKYGIDKYGETNKEKGTYKFTGSQDGKKSKDKEDPFIKKDLIRIKADKGQLTEFATHFTDRLGKKHTNKIIFSKDKNKCYPTKIKLKGPKGTKTIYADECMALDKLLAKNKKIKRKKHCREYIKKFKDFYIKTLEKRFAGKYKKVVTLLKKDPIEEVYRKKELCEENGLNIIKNDSGLAKKLITEFYESISVNLIDGTKKSGPKKVRAQN